MPKAVRSRLGIVPGQVLEVREERGRIVLRKLISEDGFASVVGILKLEKSTDELIEAMRGPVEQV